ncbi:hypothetical protein SRS16P2_00076 (plasmid) [Variovorax sp. SRS16]|nr:hypothetical protein SRS16P2_00076 [Variovorax sp. SRS16]
MLAVQVRKPGPIETHVIEEVPDLEAGPGQILVDVELYLARVSRRGGESARLAGLVKGQHILSGHLTRLELC